MRVLVIEDDALKAERIISFMDRHHDIHELIHEKSYNSGLRAALSVTPSLLILDMTLPTYDVGAKSREGRSRTMGGLDLMRKLRLKGARTPVIVVSQFTTFGEGVEMIGFDDLMAQCADEFPGTFIGGVRYRASSDGWATELKQLIDGIVVPHD